MTRRHRTTLAALFAVVPLAAGLAAAEPGHHGRHHGGFHGGPRMEKHLDELGLDDTHRKRIDAILEASREKRKAGRNEVRTEYKKLHDLLEAESPKESQVLAQVERIGKLRTEEQKAMIKTMLAVRAELTPEQREKMKQLREEAREDWREKRRERRDHHEDEPDADKEG